MYPLAEALGASVVFYGATWWRIQEKSFRLGRTAREWGNRVYGSEWNSLLPCWDEQRLASRMSHGQDVAHFLWGEFAAPLHPERVKKKARVLIHTYHGSSTRLPEVLGQSKTIKHADGITLMSARQKSFFVEHGFPVDRIETILHGMDSHWFCPYPVQPPIDDTAPLKGFMIGVTERDHIFLADVMRRVPPSVMQLFVATSTAQQVHYDGIESVTILPRLADADLRETYRKSDLLMMPVMDCTANNSILESMACGTPVMTNRIGGIPEYVPDDINIIMPDKSKDDWVDKIHKLAANRESLAAFRGPVRKWAESLDWSRVAARYLAFYERL